MYAVVHDDEDVIPDNGLVRSFTIRLRVLTFALKSSLEVEWGQRGGDFTCSSSWIDCCSRLRPAFGFPGTGRVAGLLGSAAVGGNSTVNRFA